MRTGLDLIEDIYHRRDRFDVPLDSYLFDTIELLQSARNEEHTIWQTVVWDILNTYVMKHAFFHFLLSYGDKTVKKNKNQLNYEKHIKMLERKTNARKYISKVCIAALNGDGWQTLQTLKKWKFKDYFRPRFLIFKILNMPYSLMMNFFQRFKGRYYALEILGLFSSLTEEETQAMFTYLQKNISEFDILYFSRVLSRPDMLSADNQKRLVDIISSKEFELQNIYREVLATLNPLIFTRSKVMFNNENPLSYSEEERDAIINFASQYPEMMLRLIKLNQFQYSDDSTMAEKIKKKLGIVTEPCLKVLLHVDENDTIYFNHAKIIARSITHLSYEAQQLVRNSIKTGNPRTRFLAICTFLNTEHPDFNDVEEAFNSLLEIALGPEFLEISNDASKIDDFQLDAISLLLELAQYRVDLIRRFLVGLHTRWMHEFEAGVSKVFSRTNIELSSINNFAFHLLCGEISDCREWLRINCESIDKNLADEVLEALICIENNQLLKFALDKTGTIAQNEISIICLGYILRVWPCLIGIRNVIPRLHTSNYLILPALLSLIRPNRDETHSAPVSRWSTEGDSYISIAKDINTGLKIISNDMNNDNLIFDVLENHICSSFFDAEIVMKAISCFPRSNEKILKLIQYGVEEDRYLKQGAIKALLSLPRLTKEGFELILKYTLSNEMSVDIVETSQMVDPSAVEILIDTLKNLEKITENDVTKLWLFIYIIKALLKSSGINEDVVDICKNLINQKPSIMDERLSLNERPYAAWLLGKIRPIRTDIIDILKSLATIGSLPSMVIGHFLWTKVASVISLAEITSDLSNNLTWKEREEIADIIIKIVQQPIQHEYSLFGGEGIFPENPSDAVYDAACMVVKTMKDYWAQTENKIEIESYID